MTIFTFMPPMDPKLKVFWLAFFLSSSALGIFLVSFNWLIVKNYGAYGISMTTFGYATPQLLLVLFGGLASDAINKQTLYRICQFLFLILGLTLTLVCLNAVPPLWFLVGISILNGVISAFCIPNHISLISSLVPPIKVAPTQQMFYFAAGLASVFGSLIAAHLLLVEHFFINNLHGSLTFLVYTLSSLPLIFCIPKSVGAQVKAESSQNILSKILNVFSDIRKSLFYLRTTISIRVLMRTLAIVLILGSPFTALLSIFAHDHATTHHSSTFFSHMYAALGIGYLTGSMIGIFYTRSSFKQVTIFVYFIFGLCVVAVGAIMVTPYWAISLCVLLAGLLTNLCTNLLKGLIQSQAKVDMRGRIAGFAQLLAGASSISAGIAGYIMHKLANDGVSAYLAYEYVQLTMIGLLALITLLALPSIRRLRLVAG